MRPNQRLQRGVRDDHLVAEGLEVPGHPLALGRGFEQDLRRRPRPKHRGEPLAAGVDPLLHDLAVLGQDAELTLALVQIESNIVHGGWPPVRGALTP